MINAAILGFGVVGAGTAEVLSMNSDKITGVLGEELRVKKILDIRDFPDSPFADLVTHDADEVFEDPEISIVVETIGGARIAYEYTKRALSKGKSVVTSNKELVSTHGVELMSIAEANGCCYLYEAAVGGGIPIIRPLHRCLAANRIERIAGIVNGTTNYILTNMRTAGISYDEAIKQAQSKGYAEQNPAADVDGIDAQRKLSIMSSICLEGLYVAPSEIHTTGITAITPEDVEFASEAGCAIKLLAIFENPEDGKPSAFVAPHMVRKTALLASVEDVFNGIVVVGNALGEAMFYGKGAGKLPTASAVAGDVLEVAKAHGKDTGFKNWHASGSEGRVTAEYGSIVTKAVVRTAGGRIDDLKKVFDKYDVEVAVDNNKYSAVFVRGIDHDSLIRLSEASGSVWMNMYE